MPKSLNLPEDLALAKGQIGFIDFFALPLFEAVTQVVPEMGWSVRALNENRNEWDIKLNGEKQSSSIVEASEAESKGSVTGDGKQIRHAMSSPDFGSGLGKRLAFWRKKRRVRGGGDGGTSGN